MTYTYPAMVAWDPSAKSGVFNTTWQAFATTDTTFATPLPVTDPFGNPLTGNNLNSGAQGIIPEFQQATNASVVIRDLAGKYAWTIIAIQPPTQDTTVAGFINTAGSATAAALRSQAASNWQPNTAYAAAQPVVAPTGDLVTAAVAHTSGTTYTPANWRLVSPDVSPAFRALRDTLDSGRSTAIFWTGDSTGDSDGATMPPTTPTKLMQKLGAAYPNYHVRSLHWNDTASSFDPAVVMQAANGQRSVGFAGRSLRYTAPNPSGIFTTGNLDLRVKANIPTAPTVNTALTARVSNAGTTYGTQYQYRFFFDSTSTLYLALSYNGTSWGDTIGATAPVSAALFNADTWFRVTCTIVTGTSIAVTFYSSTDDGTTWVQVGNVISYTGAYSALFNSAADFEIGGYGWQPCNDPLTGTVYEVQIRDGINGPLIAPANLERWQRYADAATTYGGSPTLWLVNGSKAGQNLAYLSDPVRMPKLSPDYGQVIAFFNTSHNEVELSGENLWIKPYKAWVASIQARLPLASPVAVIENPHTSAWVNEAAYGVSHQLRMDELRAAAGVNNWGTLEIYKAFLLSPLGLGVLISSDGLHPTDTGYNFAANIAARMAGILS